MDSPSDLQTALHAADGELPLQEYRFRVAVREWTVLHAGAILSYVDEQRFLTAPPPRLPYGVVLWSPAIALAHDVASRADAFHDRRVLEIGAGTGLPGIIAASLGGQVVQTDRYELPMSVCRRNGERNGIRTVEYRLADWSNWDDPTQYEWILGSDVLYAEKMHPHLRRIFESNLAPGGRILIADPFRPVSLRLLEAMEADGWTSTLSKWSVGEEGAPRAIGVFELAPSLD